MLRKEALKAFLIFKKIQFPEIKGKFTIIMRRRPSEDQGCLLVRHLFYSMVGTFLINCLLRNDPCRQFGKGN